MTPDPNYPRWMYHRSLDPVMIHSEAEEAALGPEWSRTVPAPLPPEEKKSAPALTRKRGRPPSHAVPESISEHKKQVGAVGRQ